MPRKKPPVIKQFFVPMEISLRGHAVVNAEGEEEAVAKAENGEFDFHHNAAEMFDWEVTGDAKEDR